MNASSLLFRRVTAAREGQFGFGLVELMISVAIGLVILAALVALFVNSSRNNREMATASSVIENGRFAIELLETDIVHAGYWGTYVPDFDDPTRDDGAPTSTPALIPDPCAAYDAVTWVTGTNLTNALIGIPVQMFDGDTVVCAGLVANRVPDTDVLVIRHAQRCLPGAVDQPCSPVEVDDPNNLYIQASLCADEVDASPYVFGRAAAGPDPFILLRRDCGSLLPIRRAEKRRVVAYIYYVRDFAVAAGDGIPTLVRSEFNLGPGGLEHQPPAPLIEGVDGLWVELGVDDVSITGEPVNNAVAVAWQDPDTKRRARNRGDGIPDGNFVRCTDGDPCTLNQLMNVTAVKVYVLARSREATRGYTDTKTYSVGGAGVIDAFNDGFKRHVYSTTVRLPNVSGRRIRPGVEPVAGPGPEPEPEPEPEPIPGPDPVPGPVPEPI